MAGHCVLCEDMLRCPHVWCVVFSLPPAASEGFFDLVQYIAQRMASLSRPFMLESSASSGTPIKFEEEAAKVMFPLDMDAFMHDELLRTVDTVLKDSPFALAKSRAEILKKLMKLKRELKVRNRQFMEEMPESRRRT
eukprot:3080341-Amphidinium_carterae.1